ncbi:MAG TPA: ribosome maturation factor RimM [Candidatus Eisenbacteria bacterium]|nr:ribosome maturation factor RimM [Candidatus Eisenbacteria bacterium]
MTDPARLVVGRVRGLHGLRGLVRIEILTDRPEARFAPGETLYVEGTTAPLTVATAGPVEDGPGWRVAFEEIPDRNAAEQLRDAYLEVAVEGEPGLGGGEVFWHEVIGAEVRGRDGRVLGRVADVYRAGEREVYVVRGGDVGDFDLAAVKGTVLEFAPERGEIVVDEAALDLEAPATAPEPAKRRRSRRWSRHGKGPAPGPEAQSAATIEENPADDVG